ncbi:MAG: DUF2258 domain-containing protein [Sulfolobales archaeon]
MPTLSSGYVIAGGYADKLRRTAFAQLRDEIRGGVISSQEVARAIGELNSTLYKILVDRFKVDKGDVVRIRIDYQIEGGKIVWDPSRLSIEVFRRDKEIDNIVRSIGGAMLWQEAFGKGVEYQVVKLGETLDGDLVYTLKLGDEEVGSLVVTRLDNELFIKKGAILHPSPMVFERLRIPIQEGESPEGVLAQKILEAQKIGRHVAEDEARKIVNYLRERVMTPPLERKVYEESQEES